MAELHELSVLEASVAIDRRCLSSQELTEHYLGRIDRLDHEVGAFVTVTADRARVRAGWADYVQGSWSEWNIPDLNGIPTAVKDLNAVQGVPMSYGSAALRNTVPDYDDYIVTDMDRCGLVSLGKTATPEFGLPCYTETDIGRPARTPWDLDRLAGGSSGGSAAAVAAGLVPIAQGSDGGGSIRIPASGCGLVGFKPSRGLLSGGPEAEDAAGLVTNGVLARTTRDAAVFLDSVRHSRPGDAPTTTPQWITGYSLLSACDTVDHPRRIGRYLAAPMVGEIDPQVVAGWEQTSQQLAALGHEIVDVQAPFPPEAVAMFETVWAVGAATIELSTHQEEQLRPLTRFLRDRGRSVSAVEFARALAGIRTFSRRALQADAANLLDAVLTPTVAQLPRPVGFFTTGRQPAEDFELQKQYTPWTAMYNMTGQPAVSLPLCQSAARDGAARDGAAKDGAARDGAAGVTPDDPTGNLPIGMMLIGKPGGDATLLSLAARLEDAYPWRDRHPPIWYR